MASDSEHPVTPPPLTIDDVIDAYEPIDAAEGSSTEIPKEGVRNPNVENVQGQESTNRKAHEGKHAPRPHGPSYITDEE